MLKKIYLFFRSAWLYPSLLVVGLIILTILQISGSSIGIYSDTLYGKGSLDTNLIFGDQREIRSDEWLVTTQTIIAQKEAGFPRINNNYGSGVDMSIVSDVPYLEWSAFFKPQNFSFFIMPLENAFAFKWWLLFVTLALSIYFFCLRILPGKKTFAIATSLIAALSPFMLWWYQTGTILPFTYGILIILVSMSLIDKNSIRLFKFKLSSRQSMVLKVILLSYLLIAFALLLYPPFQIPIALAVGFLLSGYLAKSSAGKSKKYILSIILPFVFVILITGVVCSTYIFTRIDSISAITGTAYPGKRTVPSGTYNVNYMLTTYLQGQLKTDDEQKKFYTNQSEASSFILMPLFFVAPLLYALFYTYIKKRKIEWVIVGMLLPAIILMAHLLVPAATPIMKLFFLHLVPSERAIIGLGFIAIIMLIYTAKFYTTDIKLKRKHMISILVYVALFCFISILSGLTIREVYPQFIVSRKILVLCAVTVYLGLALILSGKIRSGAIILALFSMYCAYQIHPLYVGLGPIYNSKVNEAIKAVSRPEDTWGVADDMRLESLPQMSNRKAVTGVAFYPDVSFWGKHTTSNQELVYNRYAHIVLDKKINESIYLVQPDVFVASPSCNRSLIKEIDFILSASPIDSSCMKLEKIISYPKYKFFIYKTIY